MPITIIALTRVNSENIDDLSIYLATTEPLLKEAGAKIVGRFEIEQTIVGKVKPATLTIVEYPSEDAVKLVFDSAEYGMLGEIRQRAFSHYEIFKLTEPFQVDQTPEFVRAVANAQ